MPPLLYIIFNRPDLTERTFSQLRRLAPKTLYIAADAPRAGRAGEAERCQQAREITQTIDWDCEVTRLTADENMGCGRRISSAITRVLEDHSTVIVMEDDCIADSSFFEYCDTLLDRYRDDERVMAVSGDNFQRGVTRTSASYYFSKYPHCWGWATWRRAWQHFQLTIPDWPDFRDSGGLDSHCSTQRERDFWTETFDNVHAGRVDSWAQPWTLNCWMQNGLTVLPDVNLVSNIGFGEDGTHTTSHSPFADLPRQAIGDLVHPSYLYRHAAADAATDDLVYSGPWDHHRRRRKKWFSSKHFRRRAA